MRIRSFAVAFGVAALACGLQSGTFAPQGFHHSRYAYDVRYADASQKRIMPADWRLDNYETTSSGIRAKSSGFYKTVFEFDTDRDERIDAVDAVPTFDLRFEHARSGGTVWLRTIPSPTYESRTALYILSRDYMAGIAGAGYELAQFGHQGNTRKQFSVQLIETRPASLAKFEALAVRLEVADLEELKSGSSAKRRRVKLVLVRAALTHRLPASSAEFPAILVAGYANRPEFFAQHLPDFEAFLNRIVLEDHSGYHESAPL
jgi:hypothetical protein